MRLGYVRVSANTRTAEPELRMLDEADELIVIQLDHLAPMPELLLLLHKLMERGIGVVSLADNFKTTDKQVAAVFAVLGRYNMAGARTKRVLA